GNAAANRTPVSGSISGLNLAVNDSLWLRWVDVDISGIDDGLAIDDISFTVAGDPPVDVPPSVVSTSPANNAFDVGLDATLSISFSESVSLASTWFTLDCSLSGSHSASVSGGPVSYTLTPSVSFAANESCDWTILASGVADMDGTPDALQGDHLVHFNTLDPSNLPPPAVSAVQPADGAINVPVASDVKVTFSEPVTTSSGAFALSCNATPLVLVEAGSGSTRTLTPTTVLPAGANCSFSITASAVQNGFGVPMAANFSSSFSVSDGDVSGYYGQVNTSDPGQLRCSLHTTIRGHTAYPYSGSGTSTWTILELAQASANDPNKIIDVYRNRLYQRGSDRAGTGSGITYNREHTWPNSLGFPGQNGNLGLPSAPYTDTHMLWLSDTQWNSDRGNKPFAYCSSKCGERTTEANQGVGGGSGTYPGNSNWVKSPDGNAGSFEAWNHRKGEMARAIMYMAIRYEGGVDPTSGQNEPQLELTDDRAKIVIMNNYSQTAYMGLLTDLLAWHQLDPPDAQEVARNDLIFSFQGNRNPFVDHPEWGTRALFESVSPTQCILNEVDTDIIFVHGFEIPATLH
ncbi:MAG: endonuclease, partial [Dokdonella sp.]